MSEIQIQYNLYFFILLFIITSVFIVLNIQNKSFIVIKTNFFDNKVKNNTISIYIFILYSIRIIYISILILILSNPYYIKKEKDLNLDKGLDIILAVDTSFSMLSEDLKPNRLEYIKKNIKNICKLFSNNDRIGLLQYSGLSLLRVPLTNDRNFLFNQIDNLNVRDLKNGTSIGLAIINCINHFKHTISKNRYIFLITDGLDNSNEYEGIYISPILASKIANKHNIKIYSLCVGKNTVANSPIGYDLNNNLIFKKIKVNVDEYLLKDIANNSLGYYSKIDDNIEEILKNILYKKIESNYNFKETKVYVYNFLIKLVILLFIIEVFLEKIIFKKLY